MAPQTAKICEEKREKRASRPVERFDAVDRSRFASFQDMADLPGYSVVSF
jgi:hypothetical protein